jgi:hypothetical protein
LAAANVNSASHLPLEARSKTWDATLKLPPRPACQDGIYRKETKSTTGTSRKHAEDSCLADAALPSARSVVAIGECDR